MNRMPVPLVVALAACAPSTEGRSLTRTEPASTQVCPGGGVHIKSGLDDDGDGELADAEVRQDRQVCDGVDGTDAPRLGPRLLVELAEPTPAECPHGGVVVVAGADANDDGTLQEGEITTREPLCSADPPPDALEGPQGDPGPDGTPSLAELHPATDGDCPDGGVIILTGWDRNGDGILNASEVLDRSAVCAGTPGITSARTLYGAVRVSSSVQLAAMRGVDGIEGTLQVACRGTPLPTLGDLAALTTVRDGLFIEACTTLTTLDGLDGLTTLSTDLYLADNPDLVDISALNGIVPAPTSLIARRNACLDTTDKTTLEQALATTFSAWTDNGTEAPCP